MPAIPLVIGGMSMYGGVAAVGWTWAGLAAGAQVLGGAAMVLGAIKGGKEGAKWIGDGGLVALAGAVGGSMLSQSATKAAAAGADPMVSTSATTSQAPGTYPIPGNVADAAIQGGAAPPVSVSTLPDAAPTGLMSSQGAINPAAGTLQVSHSPEYIKAMQDLNATNKTTNLLNLGGSALQGYSQEQMNNSNQDFLRQQAAELARLNNERFNTTQYAPTGLIRR